MGFVDSMYDPDRLMVSLGTNKTKGTDVDPGWVVMKTEDAGQESFKMKTYKPEKFLDGVAGRSPPTRLWLQSIGCTPQRSADGMFRHTLLHQLGLTLTNPPNKFYSSCYTPGEPPCAVDYTYDANTGLVRFDSFRAAKRHAQSLGGGKSPNKIVMFNPARTPMTDNFASVSITRSKPGNGFWPLRWP